MQPNKKVKIGGHNEKILETTPPPEEKLCNSLKKENYLMRGACLIENVLNTLKQIVATENINLKCIKRPTKLPNYLSETLRNS